MELWGLMMIFRNFPISIGNPTSVSEGKRLVMPSVHCEHQGFWQWKRQMGKGCHAALNVVALICQSPFCTISADQQHFFAVIHVCDFTITSDSVFFCLLHSWETAVCKSCLQTVSLFVKALVAQKKTQRRLAYSLSPLHPNKKTQQNCVTVAQSWRPGGAQGYSPNTWQDKQRPC